MIDNRTTANEPDALDLTTSTDLMLVLCRAAPARRIYSLLANIDIDTIWRKKLRKCRFTHRKSETYFSLCALCFRKVKNTSCLQYGNQYRDRWSRDVTWVTLLSQSSVVYIFKRICGMLVFACRSLVLCCHLVCSVLLHVHTHSKPKKMDCLWLARFCYFSWIIFRLFARG